MGSICRCDDLWARLLIISGIDTGGILLIWLFYIIVRLYIYYWVKQQIQQKVHIINDLKKRTPLNQSGITNKEYEQKTNFLMILINMNILLSSQINSKSNSLWLFLVLLLLMSWLFKYIMLMRMRYLEIWKYIPYKCWAILSKLYHKYRSYIKR